jgi:hypothetical protein
MKENERSLKGSRSCKNCKFGEIDNKYHGYTHCNIFNASFGSESKCKKYERETTQK